VGLGDLLATVPALRALRAARPDAEVVMITWSEMAAVVARMAPYVDELLPFPGYEGIPDRPVDKHASPSFFRRAQSLKLDLALQMYGGQRAANEVTERLGARLTGGFYTPGMWPARPSTHLRYPRRSHEIHRHLELMRFLGVPSGSDRMEFPLRPQDAEEREALLRRFRLRPKGYVCLHPGSKSTSRRWPPERFAGVADALAAEGWQVALVGTPSERSLAASVARQTSTAVADLCGRTTLGGLGAVLSSSALLIGNDSGPSHLATALQVPSVTIFMAGDPQRWAALDRTLHRVVHAGVSCRPCGLLECPIDLRCGWRVSAGTVLSEARDLLSSATSLHPRSGPTEVA
jgi:ADP-heptose:LPS heptosyltransferase